MNLSLQGVNKKVLPGFGVCIVAPPNYLLFTFYVFLEIVLGLWEFGELGHELHYFDISLQAQDPLLSSSLYLSFFFFTSWIWN